MVTFAQVVQFASQFASHVLLIGLKYHFSAQVKQISADWQVRQPALHFLQVWSTSRYSAAVHLVQLVVKPSQSMQFGSHALVQVPELTLRLRSPGQEVHFSAEPVQL